MDTTMSSDFVLSQQLIGHVKGVRCICVLPDARIVSGGQDGFVYVWTLEGGKYKFGMKLTHHTNFVYSVAASASTDPVTFYTGGYDQRIWRVNAESGTTLLQYQGHSGPVCSLLESHGTLYSGSWDGTARAWDANTGACLYTMPGHTHAVAVGVLSNGEVVTGSQDKQIRFWKKEHCHKVMQGHDDIIRSFACFSTGFVSASNDQTAKVWTLDGCELKTLEGHGSYVYDIKVSAEEKPDGLPCRVYTASDDRTCKVWEVEGADGSKQALVHAATVFQVCVLPNGDIATACEDGVVRVWTMEESRAASLEERTLQSEQAERALVEAQQKGAEAIDTKNLPDVSQTATLRGTKVGQTKLFREGSAAVVYQWSGRQWEKLGEVVGAPSSSGVPSQAVHYEGDPQFPAGMYDYVFSVELGENNYKKLPYKMGENPLIVAERFIAREQIPRNLVNDIASFIRQNTGQTGPVGAPQQAPANQRQNLANALSAPSAAQQPAAKAAPAAAAGGAGASAGTKHWPVLDYLTFPYAAQKVLDPLCNKLIELSDALGPEFAEFKMDELDKTYLKEGLARLKHAAPLKQVFRKCEMDLFFKKMGGWPAASFFPVADLWRIMLLHPQTSELHKGSDDGWHFVSVILNHMKHDSNGVLGMLGARYLAHMFFLPTCRYVMHRRRGPVCDLLSELAGCTNKNTRTALATVLLNYGVLFREKNDPEGRLQVLSLINEYMQSEIEPEAAYRLLAALGTLLHEDATTLEFAKQLEIGATAKGVGQKFAADARVVECCKALGVLVA